jgi:hypothetical protein
MSLNRYDCIRPFGELAQLVECCDRTAEARGSNPLFSIRLELPNQRMFPEVLMEHFET